MKHLVVFVGPIPFDQKAGRPILDDQRESQYFASQEACDWSQQQDARRQHPPITEYQKPPPRPPRGVKSAAGGSRAQPRPPPVPPQTYKENSRQAHLTNCRTPITPAQQEQMLRRLSPVTPPPLPLSSLAPALTSASRDVICSSACVL